MSLYLNIVYGYLFVLLIVLLLALLLNIQLWFLSLLLRAFILFTSGTHNRFSFRINGWRLIPRLLR